MEVEVEVDSGRLVGPEGIPPEVEEGHGVLGRLQSRSMTQRIRSWCRTNLMN